jgi:hypothetical protein
VVVSLPRKELGEPASAHKLEKLRAREKKKRREKKREKKEKKHGASEREKEKEKQSPSPLAWVFLLDDSWSAPRSAPAKSMSENLPTGSPLARSTSRSSMAAWLRLDVAFASVSLGEHQSTTKGFEKTNKNKNKNKNKNTHSGQKRTLQRAEALAKREESFPGVAFE